MTLRPSHEQAYTSFMSIIYSLSYAITVVHCLLSSES